LLSPIIVNMFAILVFGTYHHRFRITLIEYMEKIQTTGVSDQFKAHLSDVNNQRIIFSGSFGSGKTTFLNDFFKTKEQSDKYYVCKLFPVNYVTSDNKDIYELMKFDILIQLLGSGVTLGKSDFDKLSTVSKSIKKNSLKLLQGIMGVASLIDGRAAILSKAVEVISDIYEKYKDQDSETKVDRFLADLENQLGSSYEMNDISRLINEMLIKASKLEEKEKETVLLIDDFDRLEPMQSFRLLNILSTNDNETGTGENKFGFDKIIIVCDIGNLRDCFAHINGTSNAFNGYIDKFYSTQIFNFDIQNDLIKAISVWFVEIKISRDVREEFYEMYIDIIKQMISCGSLNIRSLTKMQYATAIDVPSKQGLGYHTEIDYMKLFFSVLRQMFVGDQEVSTALSLCSKRNIMFLYSNNRMVVDKLLGIMFPEKLDGEDAEPFINKQKYKFKAKRTGLYLSFDFLATDVQLSDSGDILIPVLSFIDEIKQKYLNI